MFTSLRSKILAILVLLLCTVAALSFGVSAYLFNQSLRSFEHRTAQDLFARVESGFGQEVDALVRLAVDNAVWDDAAAHLEKADNRFLEKTFTLESLKNIQVNAIAFFTLDGRLHSSVDTAQQRRGTLDPQSPLVQSIRQALLSPALAKQEGGGNLKLWIDGAPVLVAFSPVTNSDADQPPKGWLVLVRSLKGDALKSLVQITGAHFWILNASQGQAEQPPSHIISRAMSDSRGLSALRLELEPGNLQAQRSTGLWLLLVNAVVLVVLAAAAAVLVFDRLILKRLTLFALKARELHGPQIGARLALPVTGRDELDALAVALNTMVIDLDQTRTQLLHDVRTDALTGLGNRRLLYEELDHVLGQRNRQIPPAALTIAVLLIDIDDFKLINDSLGHEAGNFLLKEIAHALQVMVRATDIVTRLGGDEFALVYVAESDDLGVERFAVRVQETIAQPRMYKGSVLTVSSSVGIAYATAHADKDALLRNADLAMYAAKQTGKGRHSFFKDEMLGNVQERMQMEQRLRECLRLDQLEVWFQPIVDVTTNQVTMFEALARWPLEEGGFCPPDKFIPVAEESGLITQLGADIARKVVAAMPALRAINPQHVVNINLSPKQLMSKLLVVQMCELVDEAKLPRSCIHFELTETALATDADTAKLQLDALADAGFHLHLDDFGTGYSSLHRLQSMPFSTLKLDRSFVLLMSKGDDRIARVIISLAAQLGMAVIAEGIETAEQQAELVELGCTLIQGYYHAKPMPLDKLLPWVQARQVHA